MRPHFTSRPNTSRLDGTLALLCASLALAGTALSGCGNGASCAVDTDCMLGQYCSIAGACVDRGAGTDGGPRDSGPPMDTGPRDAPAGDGPRTDTPATDSGPDAPSSCPAVAGTYTLTMVGMSCTGLGATTMMLNRGPLTECSFELFLDDRTTGFVNQTTGNTFTGSLTGIPGGPACTVTFTTDLSSVAVVCGACMFSAMGT